MLPGMMPMPGLHGHTETGGNDAFTELLLHMDGADASTSFPDSSSNALSVTVGGNAQVDTAQSKFGGASALFDGTGDYLKTPSSAALNVATGDFTIDFWVRFAANPGGGQYQTIFKKYSADYGIERSENETAISFWTGTSYIIHGSTALSLSTWYHVAFVRYGTTLKSYINGTQDGSGTFSDSVDFSDWSIALTTGLVDLPLSGWIDEFRLSSVARWTANFTPPANPYS